MEGVDENDLGLEAGIFRRAPHCIREMANGKRDRCLYGDLDRLIIKMVWFGDTCCRALLDRAQKQKTRTPPSFCLIKGGARLSKAVAEGTYTLRSSGSKEPNGVLVGDDCMVVKGGLSFHLYRSLCHWASVLRPASQRGPPSAKARSRIGPGIHSIGQHLR